METAFIKLGRNQKVIANPIYMSREQYEDAAYIPEEYLSRIIIVGVDLAEEEDDTRTEDTESR